MPSLNTGNAILSNPIKVDSSYNVGIGGAASGSYKLQVTGTGNFTSRLTIGDAVGSSPLVWARSGGSTGYLYSDADNVGITNVLDFGAGYEGILLNSSTSAINFYTNGVSTPRLAIASNGAATFSNSVTSSLNGFNALGAYGFTSYEGAAASGKNIQFTLAIFNSIDGIYQSSGNTNDFGIWTNGGTSTQPKLYIKNGGNVGIGTSNPTAYGKFAVAGAITVGSLSGVVAGFSDDVNGTTRLYIQNGINGINVDQAFVISTGGANETTERMRINTNGKVTIPSGAYGTSYYTMNYTSANAGSREWAIGSDTAGWGSFSIGQATTQGGSTFSDKIVISSGGNVGIGRIPITNILEINGDASKTSAGSWLANSDINIKTDINTIQGALERINKVRLVSFKYKDEYKEVYTSIKDKYYQNVIAQEYQEIYPDYVYDSSEIFEEHNILQVDTNPMFVDSVSAIQELYKIVQEQQAQIEELKAIVATK